MTISAIIMTRNAERTIDSLLFALEKQTCPPLEILVCDNDSEDSTVQIALSHPIVQIISIPRNDFDHGGSRHMGAMKSKGDILCFFTQDALPVHRNYLSNLTSVFFDNEVACACGRQIAKIGSSPEEKLTREYNYPAVSFVRSSYDIKEMGIKAYFLSDVCSAYRREDYLAVGGFDLPLLTNEDMLMAAKQLARDKKIAYCADAEVWHSHAYSLLQDFRRSFDTGVFLSEHRGELGNTDVNSEGLRYVFYVLKNLLLKFHVVSCIRFLLHCAARYWGNRDGHHFDTFSLKKIIHRSAQPNYWIRYYAQKSHDTTQKS